MNDCKVVCFSDKAYNSIVYETFEWEPVETGGFLLGHILDNGYWIVMVVLPLGYGEGHEGDKVYHKYGYFEYNRKFFNYLTKSVAEQYKMPLELLGHWHRHPEHAFPQVKSQQEAKFSIYPMSIMPRAELPSDMKDNYHLGEL